MLYRLALRSCASCQGLAIVGLVPWPCTIETFARTRTLVVTGNNLSALLCGREVGEVSFHLTQQHSLYAASKGRSRRANLKQRADKTKAAGMPRKGHPTGEGKPVGLLQAFTRAKNRPPTGGARAPHHRHSSRPTRASSGPCQHSLCRPGTLGKQRTIHGHPVKRKRREREGRERDTHTVTAQ